MRLALVVIGCVAVSVLAFWLSLGASVACGDHC